MAGGRVNGKDWQLGLGASAWVEAVAPGIPDKLNESTAAMLRGIEQTVAALRVITLHQNAMRIVILNGAKDLIEGTFCGHGSLEILRASSSDAPRMTRFFAVPAIFKHMQLVRNPS